MMGAQKSSRLDQPKARLVALMENECGLSAIEFALIAPLFVIGFVMTSCVPEPRAP